MDEKYFDTYEKTKTTSKLSNKSFQHIWSHAWQAVVGLLLTISLLYFHMTIWAVLVGLFALYSLVETALHLWWPGYTQRWEDIEWEKEHQNAKP